MREIRREGDERNLNGEGGGQIERGKERDGAGREGEIVEEIEIRMR